MIVTRAVVAALALAFLTGCGLKARTFNEGGRGYAMGLGSHSGSVCLLPGKAPASVEKTYIGVLKGRRGAPGAFEPVRRVMVEEARNIGADMLEDTVMRQDLAFRGIFFIRPIGEGIAYQLKDHDSFDCVANGGLLYEGTGSPPKRLASVPVSKAQPAAVAAPASIQAKPTQVSYDQCMERVLRIQDAQLRLESMSLCDGVK